MTVRLSVILGILLAWSARSQAAGPQLPGEGVAGDGEGFRSYLHDQGYDFHFGYLSETATNVEGGDREIWRYADQWTFATTLDLQKLLGLDRARFQLTITSRNGRNLSADANLGSLQEVQEIYGRGQTWRWTQFSYDQQYLDGKLDWKVGRLTGGEDFADFSCEFMNLTFCGPPPGNISINYWYNWPVSTWATRLRASFKGFGYVQLGVYEVNPRYLRTREGLDLGEPGGASGVLVPLEVGWQPTFGDQLNGTYKFGAWYNSSNAPDVAENANRQSLVRDGGPPLMHTGHYGSYVHFLQRLTAPPVSGSRRGVSVFFNATFDDRRSATLDSQIATGVFYTGAFASRPADELGFAIGRTHVNSRIRKMEPTRFIASEYVGELFYSVHAADWLELRPNVQLIHPEERRAQNSDDVIVGLRLSVNL